MTHNDVIGNYCIYCFFLNGYHHYECPTISARVVYDGVFVQSGMPLEIDVEIPYYGD